VIAVSKTSYFKLINKLLIATIFSGVIAVILAFLLSLIGTKGIVKAIKEINRTASKADTGDLTVRAHTDSGSYELKELSCNFNTMLSTFGSLVKEISASIEEMTAASDGLSVIAEKTDESTANIYSHIQKMADGSEGQQNFLEQIRESTENVSDNIQSITHQIDNATKASSIMLDTVNLGLKAMNELGSKIAEIKDSSAATVNYIIMFENQLNEINSITNTIRSISGQTKLLSLNASIEAARAGEYGYGFTVVAQEIQKLAHGSAQSALEVGEIIKKIRESTQAVLKIANQGKTVSDEGAAIAVNTDNIFSEVLNKVSETHENINNISTHAFSISDNIQVFANHIAKTTEILNDMAESTREVASIAENNYGLSRDVSSNAQGLKDIADKLNRLKNKFKT
jgi:methyl-accepting chemotaxis protein